MNAIAGNIQFNISGFADPQARHLPGVDFMPWGYVVGGTDRAMSARGIGAMAARFSGAILFLAGLGLWLMPDSLMSDDVYVMKMAAMVVFTLVGGVLVWSGRQRPGMEVQVDLTRQELRLGGRDLHGAFRLYDLLRFDEVKSVFLFRAEGHGPARLYLRVGTGDTGVEVSRGAQKDMEVLRDRLIADLKRVNI